MDRKLLTLGALALAALACGPASGGEAPEILRPDPVALPVAAGFLPHLGELRVGAEPDARVYVLGGEGRPAFTLMSGRLPDGVTLSPEGLIVGRAAAPGSFAATVRAGAGPGPAQDVPVSILVLPAEPAR